MLAETDSHPIGDMDPRSLEFGNADVDAKNI